MGKMLLLAVSPILALLIYIYQKDRYDREPSLLLAKLFVSGCIIALPIYFSEKLLSLFSSNPFYQAFIVAGLTEEVFKFLIIMRIAYNSISYDEKLDGIIYSVFTSLGFATVENVLYVIGIEGNYIYTGITRAMFAIPAHMLFAITMGYYLSMSKFSTRRGKLNTLLIKSVLIPVFLHGIYDVILFLRQYGLFPVFIIFVIYLWKTNLKRLNEYVKESRNKYN